MWNSISEILNRTRNQTHGIKFIIDDGKLVDNEFAIANKFNEFFIGIGPKMRKNMKNINDVSYQNYLSRNILTSFSFSLVDDDIMMKTIKKINTKSSTGHDGISTKLLKFLYPVLYKPLIIIINQSLLTGIFPEKLKTAKVIPLFKSGDKAQMNNYRPISLLPAISKLIEKVVYDQLYKYFTENNLFYDSQYGFREAHSTELAVNELTDRILNQIDQNKLPFAVFMDLSKAFDTLDHTILLGKLRYYGVNGTALTWFSNYLSNRTQFVEINDVKSDVLKITTGVPQGSILGPILFLIYMNDIFMSSNFFNFILFADDTTLSGIIEYSPEIPECATIEVINTELDKVATWLSVNKLSLNIKKTKYMVFHTKHKNIKDMPKSLVLCDQEIERVNSFDFLGITIDNNMTWNHHITKISNKISKFCGILNRLKHYLPPHIMRIIYHSMVHSHINYGILAWGYNHKRIFKIQKRAIRIITKSKYNAHTEPLFKMMDIIRVPDLLLLNSMKFYYKFTKGNIPSYFYSFNFQTQGDIHNYNTRNIHQLRLNRTRLHLTDNCLRNYIPKNINRLPSTLIEKVHTHSLQGFSSAVKLYILKGYSAICNIQNCYICHR
jgi:hypothetical protein